MNILLIRLRLAGDVVFTTPAIRALRRHFPPARITHVVEQQAAAIVVGHPHVDETLVVSRRRGWRRLADDVRLARALRARRFDLVIDFHGGPRSSWLAAATGAPRRIGYAVPGRAWLYTDRVHRPRELRARHSVENQWDLLEPLGIPAPDPDRDPVEMAESATAQVRVAARLEAAGIPPGAELVVVHVSAGNPFRRWPAESFASLVAGLAAARPARRVLLTSGPSEAGAAEEIAGAARGRLSARAAAQIVCDQDFDLADLRVLIGRSALFIGGDSGPLHVAATTRTPIVGIYGPTLPARSAPWRDRALVTEAVQASGLTCRPCDQRVCVHGDFRCLADIAPAEVSDAAERALARSRRSDRSPDPVATAAAH